MPFKPETPIPKTRDEIITAGVITLRQAHKANIEAHRIAFDARAEQRWVEHLAKQKADWIATFKEDNYVKPPYPYSDYSQPAQYRVSLEPDRRIDGLAAVELYDEMLYCFLARSGSNKATVDQVKAWFKPYFEVDGDYSILVDRDFPDRTYTTDHPTHSNVIIHAKELSKQLADILCDTWMIDVRFGQVVWKERDIEHSEY